MRIRFSQCVTCNNLHLVEPPWTNRFINNATTRTMTLLWHGIAVLCYQDMAHRCLSNGATVAIRKYRIGRCTLSPRLTSMLLLKELLSEIHFERMCVMRFPQPAWEDQTSATRPQRHDMRPSFIRRIARMTFGL